MFTTSLNDAGRVIVIDDAITDDTPQNFVVCIKNESDCCLLYTSPSPRDPKTSRMPSSA